MREADNPDLTQLFAQIDESLRAGSKINYHKIVELPFNPPHVGSEILVADGKSVNTPEVQEWLDRNFRQR